MSRRPKQIFSKENIEMASNIGNMFSTTNYSGNANQNYNEVSAHTDQNGHHQKNLQRVSAEEGLE